MTDDFILKWDEQNQQLFGEDPDTGDRTPIPFEAINTEELTVGNSVELEDTGLLPDSGFKKIEEFDLSHGSTDSIVFDDFDESFGAYVIRFACRVEGDLLCRINNADGSDYAYWDESGNLEIEQTEWMLMEGDGYSVAGDVIISSNSNIETSRPGFFNQLMPLRMEPDNVTGFSQRGGFADDPDVHLIEVFTTEDDAFVGGGDNFVRLYGITGAK